MTEKDDILERLSKLSADEIDRKRDEKLLELREMSNKFYIAKDTEFTLKYNTRKKLLNEGHSFSKVENMLRADEELFKLKRLVMEYGSVKKKIELELEILKSLYWRARA